MRTLLDLSVVVVAKIMGRLLCLIAQRNTEQAMDFACAATRPTLRHVFEGALRLASISALRLWRRELQAADAELGASLDVDDVDRAERPPLLSSAASPLRLEPQALQAIVLAMQTSDGDVATRRGAGGARDPRAERVGGAGEGGNRGNSTPGGGPRARMRQPDDSLLDIDGWRALMGRLRVAEDAACRSPVADGEWRYLGVRSCALFDLDPTICLPMAADMQCWA